MDSIGWVINNIEGIIAVVTGVVAVASAIAALTPTKSDDDFLGKVYKILDTLALNVGKAKDK